MTWEVVAAPARAALPVAAPVLAPTTGVAVATACGNAGPRGEFDWMGAGVANDGIGGDAV